MVGIGTHRTQYDGSPFANQNCAPTSLANAARVWSGGRIDRTGAYVRALVKRDEEIQPHMPGWSHPDVALAARRLGVPFVMGSQGWAGVVDAVVFRRVPVLLSGDSDRFGDATCSGRFDGDHEVVIYPEVHGDGRWLLGDPICSRERWERPDVLRAYATRFDPAVRYGVVPTMKPLSLTPGTSSEIVATLARDAELRAEPTADSLSAGRVRKGDTYDLIAYGGGGWRGLRVLLDGKPVIAYVPLAAITTARKEPPPAPECGPVEAAALDRARDAAVAAIDALPREA